MSGGQLSRTIKLLNWKVVPNPLCYQRTCGGYTVSLANTIQGFFPERQYETERCSMENQETKFLVLALLQALLWILATCTALAFSWFTFLVWKWKMLIRTRMTRLFCCANHLCFSKWGRSNVAGVAFAMPI